MSQQQDDDLARALEGLGGTTPQEPAPVPQRPVSKTPQIKIEQAPSKPLQPAVRPTTPGAKSAQSPKPLIRATSQPAPATPRAARAASPLDAPAALATASEAKPVVSRAAKQPSARRDGFQRTLIPVLLTLGFILVGLCAVRFLWQSIDNPMLAVPANGAAVVGAGGVLLWALAAFLMAGVAKRLSAIAEKAAQKADSTVAPVPKRPSRAANPD